jgi:putative ABC transport system permease protein
MRWWYELKYIMRKLNRRRAEQEAEEEIQTHLELETREKIEDGLSPEEAPYAARRAFGSIALAKEDSRAVWGLRALEILWQDLRYGLRMMLKRPGFTLIAIGMLAIGIAANTTVFSIADALILRPFDFPNERRLVMIWSQSLQAGFDHKYLPIGVFTDWQEQSQSFEQVVGYTEGFFDLTGADQAERFWGYSVYANFFDALGVKAELGRTFQKGEDEPGRDQVVLLRHSFWQRRFASDPNILGKTLTLNGKAFTVIGVMPAGFNFPVNDGQIWIPLTFDEKEKRNHKRVMSGLGLLRPGVSAQQASAELDSIWRKAQEIYPDLYAGLSTQVVGMTEDYVRNTKMYMPPLIGAVAFTLLIVCANVANMSLGRALGRRKEIAVRLALGASRRRVIGQMLIESLLLALGGGFTGLLLSVWAVKLLKGMMPESLTIFIPGFERLGINSIALLFTLLISALTAILFGMAPAWQSSRPNLNEGLKEGMKGASSADLRGRPRSLLVIVEVALSLVLLIGAGLMFRSFTAMLRDDLGFKPENLLSFQMMVSGGVEKRRSFYDRLLKRLEALPGVTATGASDALPMGGNQNAVIKIVGRPPSEKDEKTFVDYRVVTPGYFNAIGMPLRRGRDFITGDHDRDDGSVCMDRAAARRNRTLRGNGLFRLAAHTRDWHPPRAGRAETQHSAADSRTGAEVDARGNDARNGWIAGADQGHGAASVWRHYRGSTDLYSSLLDIGRSGAAGLLAAGAASYESGSVDRTAK